MFTLIGTPKHAYIIVAKDIAEQYNIKKNPWAKLIWEGEYLVGAEIQVNGSTTYLARGTNEFEVA